MENEIYRLSTYHNFPIDAPVYPIRLAEAGFYYQGFLDEVTCYTCNVRHSSWEKNQDPFKIHSSLSSGCSFIKQHPKTKSEHGENSNAGEKMIKIVEDSPRSECQLTLNVGACDDKKGIRSLFENESEISDVETTKLDEQNRNITNNETMITIPQPCSQPSPQIGELHRTAMKSTNPTRFDFLGITTARPRYSSFAIQAVRHASYKTWPRHLRQQPLELATVGFFYEGHGDNVRCFFCGGGLKDWEPEDDPWIEHARWFPKCVFLRQSKGDKFISDVQSGLLNFIKSNEQLTNLENENNHKTRNHENYIHMDDSAVLTVIESGSTPKQKTHSFNFKDHKNITTEILLQAAWDTEDTQRANNIETVKEESVLKEHLETNETETCVQDTSALATENQNLKEMKMCKICLDEEASIVFLPCGHLVSCPSCAPALLKCPICRKHVRGTIKAIMS